MTCIRGLGAALVTMMLCSAAGIQAAAAQSIVDKCLAAPFYPDGNDLFRDCGPAIEMKDLDKKTVAQINLQIGHALYFAHRPGIAIPYLDKALQSDPTLDQAWRRRGWAHLMMNHGSDAMADFTAYLELSPTDPDALFGLAFARQQLSGNCAAAVRDYEQILKEHPDHYITIFNLAGMYHCRDGNQVRQLEKYDKIISAGRERTSGVTYYGRGGGDDLDFYAMMRGLRADAYLDARRAAEAANDVDWLVQNYPRHFKIFMWRSRLKLLQHDFAGALADAETTLDRFPWDVKAIEAKVESLRRLRRHDDLITYVSSLLASGTGFSNQDFLLFWRSYSYKRLGKKDEAITDVNQAMALNPGYIWSVSTQLEQSGYIFSRIPRYGIDPTPDFLSKPFANALEACMVDPECMI